MTDVARARATILADALRDVVAELRLIEPGDLIGHIRNEQWAAISDLVQASAELYLREGSLIFSCAADFTLDWASTPCVSLEMEFRNDALCAFFRLVLDRTAGLVALRDVWFPNMPEDEVAGTTLLANAVAAARLHHGSAPAAANRRR